MQINESFKSNNIRDFIEIAKKISKENKYWSDIYFIFMGDADNIYMVSPEGEKKNGRYKIPLGEITDVNIYGQKTYVGDDLKRVLKTQNEVNIKMICDKTKDNKLSCLAVTNDKAKGKVLAAIFIDPNGSEQIKQMILKSESRKEANNHTKLTDAQQKIAEWRGMFDMIKKKYSEYRKKEGDAKALDMSDAVNKLCTNEELIGYMKKNIGDVSKADIKSYLYAYLLDFDDPFGFLTWMKKDKRFQKLHARYHKDDTD